MEIVKRLGLVLWILVATTSGAWAGYDYKFDPQLAPYGQFESEVAGKLSRGLTNIAYGWTELAQAPIRTAEEPTDGFWKTTFVGVPKGFGRFLGRTFIGVYEVATFYVPQKPLISPIEGTIQ